MSDHDEGGSFFAGILVGGLVGAAIGLLLAPRPGQETVRIIREKSGGIRSRGEQFLNEDGRNLRELADDVREIVREAAEEAREVLRDAVAQGREARDRATSELQREYDQARTNQ